jgi:hypothetical protein
MGYVEELDKLELSDDIKAALIKEHRKEIDPLKTTNDSLTAQSRLTKVEGDIEKWGLSDHPGVAKIVRRALLSPDAEQPGAILLSDAEMGLEGDKATGATGREETSVASVVRSIFEAMPKNSEGKLNLSDQMLSTDDHSRPEDGDENDPAKKSEKSKSNLSKITGKSTKRSGKRYGQEGVN